MPTTKTSPRINGRAVAGVTSRKPGPLELTGAYEILYAAFGPQRWWPARTPLEVAVGAVLTQNTNWQNVERAIANLRGRGLLSARALGAVSLSGLARAIRPSGYFNVKARRLKAFIGFLGAEFGGSMARMRRHGTGELRQMLLKVYGIGPETADSILLYALGKPIFVIDAYTVRILGRHGMVGPGPAYAEVQGLFHSALKPDAAMFNEYHALLVRLGKYYCRPRNPLCGDCPLGEA